ncbi:ABC transporter permease [Candidatus Saccharibacteria bacterium oral taxon 488]|nr:ABC transporter permease [Candidatus Saccharibacteria bacterium oral taxon 488]
MSKMHNLGMVFKFEVLRTLKKPIFWLVAIGFPVMIGLMFGVIFWSNRATQEAAEKLQEQNFSITMTDDSGLVKPEIAAAMKVQRVNSEAEGVEKVKHHQTDAYFYIPKNLEKDSVRIYGQDTGLFENNKYEAVVRTLLSRSVDSKVTGSEAVVIKQKITSSLTTYKNGKESGGIKEVIVPGFFLALFYLLIAFFGNQMLTSTIEEKENRTVEMLLTTVRAKTLIVGKIWALITLSLIQGMVIVAPVFIGYLLFGHQLHLPNFDLSQIVFDPTRIVVAIALFGASFMMLTGLLVTVGAMMPTAKEASSWVGLVMILLFGPLYGGSVFISYPESTFSMAMSYFPLTAPIPLMLRNAVGNLSLIEALIGVAVLVVSAVLIMMLAVRVFRYGAMSYDSKLSLSALRMKRKTGKV